MLGASVIVLCEFAGNNVHVITTHALGHYARRRYGSITIWCNKHYLFALFLCVNHYSPVQFKCHIKATVYDVSHKS